MDLDGRQVYGTVCAEYFDLAHLVKDMLCLPGEMVDRFYEEFRPKSKAKGKR